MTDPHPFAIHGTGKALRHARNLGLVALGLLVVGAGLRLGIGKSDARALEARTHAGLTRSVSTVVARAGEARRSVTLPASLRGSSETALLARSPGYLAAWHKTLGDRVKKGELLATIDAPEQDQELAQAVAAREQVQVRLDLAEQTLKRWEKLNLLDSVAKQDVDEKRGAVAQARADLAAAVANVRRLQQMKAFRRVVAPFDGVITRRSVEVGDLIAANGKELFAIAQTDTLRLSLWVPQVYASDIREGQEVSLSIPEKPGQRLAGKVAHAAGALDPATRSRQIELLLPNPDGSLLPGTYGEVTIRLASGKPTLLVPTNVLVIGQDGPRVVAVGGDSHVAFRKVTLGRDLGRDIEVLSGIVAGEVLVSSPSDLLSDGERVSATALPDKSRKNGPPPPKDNPPAKG